MKIILLIVSATLFFINRSLAEWTDDLRRIETEQVIFWEQKLNEARAVSPGERPAQLWLGLRNLGYRNLIDGRSPQVQVIYRMIQDELLSIPGHAHYFAAEIKREQKEVAKYPTNTGPRISYDRNRSMYFITLSHLPSPETIAVLGEFLADDIDTPRPKISPHSDWGENPKANSFASTNALSLIGLREPPATKDFYDADPDAHLAMSRAWWEKIRNGEQTFSFMGQNVEYRFKPDGTWDSSPIANPPDDRPKLATVIADEHPVERASSVEQESQGSPRPISWWLYGIVVSIFLAIGAWFFWKNRFV